MVPAFSVIFNGLSYLWINTPISLRANGARITKGASTEIFLEFESVSTVAVIIAIEVSLTARLVITRDTYWTPAKIMFRALPYFMFNSIACYKNFLPNFITEKSLKYQIIHAL